MNLETIVKSIAKIYNNCDIKVQQLIKLSWWERKKYTDNSNVEDVKFFNELEDVSESIATEKELNLFLLLSNGVCFEEAGSIFGVKSQRAIEMLNQLLDRLAK